MIRLRLGKQPRKRRWVQQEQWQGDTWSVPRQQVEVELEPLATEPLPDAAFSDVALPSNGFVQGEGVDFAAVEPERETVRRRPSVNKSLKPEPNRRIQDVFNRLRPQVRSNGVILSEAEIEENRLAAAAEAAARAAAYRDERREEADDYLPPSNAVLGFRDREIDTGWQDRRDIEDSALAADEDRYAEDDYSDDWDDSLDQLAANLPSNAVLGRLRDEDDVTVDEDDEWLDEDDDRETAAYAYESARKPRDDDDDEFYDDDLDDYAAPPRRRTRDDYGVANLPSNGVVMTFDDDPDQGDDWDEEEAY